MDDVEWECEIKIRRNGRLVQRSNVLGDDPASALYGAETEISRWASDSGLNAGDGE